MRYLEQHSLRLLAQAYARRQLISIQIFVGRLYLPRGSWVDAAKDPEDWEACPGPTSMTLLQDGYFTGWRLPIEVAKADRKHQAGSGLLLEISPRGRRYLRRNDWGREYRERAAYSVGMDAISEKGGRRFCVMDDLRASETLACLIARARHWRSERARLLVKASQVTHNEIMAEHSAFARDVPRPGRRAAH